jgi:hypothetical protein
MIWNPEQAINVSPQDYLDWMQEKLTHNLKSKISFSPSSGVIHAKFASDDIKSLEHIYNGEVSIGFSVEAFILGSTDYGLVSNNKPSKDFSIKFIDSSQTT